MKTINILYTGKNEQILNYVKQTFKNISIITSKSYMVEKADEIDLAIIDKSFLNVIKFLKEKNPLIKIIIIIDSTTDLKDLIDIDINGFIFSPINELQMKKVIENTLKLIYLEKQEKSYLESLIEAKTKALIIDEVTGFYNIAKFKQDSKEFIDKFIVIIDINNFKKINSAFGFDFGDTVLKNVADIIKLLPFERIYKFPGDVFIGIIEYVAEKTLKNFLNILTEISIKFKGFPVYLTFSIVAFKVEEENSIDLFTRAFNFFKDNELKNSYHIVTKQMLDEIASKSQKISYILKNVKESKVIPYFQPIVDNHTKEIASYEVLARIEDEGKVISPYFFIDDAKKAGIIRNITKIIIEKAFIKIANTNTKISINLTDEDILEKGFIEFLHHKLEENNLKTSQITIEVLENISLTEEILYKLKLLKFLGFKIAIDDFGTGYSNFEKFLEMSPDFLKIDGSFIKNIYTNPNAAKIVSSMNVFAHAMGSKVIAEFVENEDIYKKISSMGIEYSQGYYFYKPSKELAK